jgi:hypothetical protein
MTQILHFEICILHLKVVLPAGLAPASIRLEDECLVYFGHGSGAPELDCWINGFVDEWILQLFQPIYTTIYQSINPPEAIAPPFLKL